MRSLSSKYFKMKSSQLHPSNRSEYQEYEGKKLVLSTNHYFGCFKSFLKPRKVKGSLFIFSLNIHVTTLRFYFKGIFHNFYKTSISLAMSNHCQPPKYSCNRYCCGDEKGNYVMTLIMMVMVMVMMLMMLMLMKLSWACRSNL